MIVVDVGRRRGRWEEKNSLPFRVGQSGVYRETQGELRQAQGTGN